MDCGTTAIPSPAETRLKADTIRGASWPICGLNPAFRQAAIVVSKKIGPSWRA
jgi:hypothetical protein